MHVKSGSLNSLNAKLVCFVDQYKIRMASLIVKLVNHLPAMLDTQVRFLGQEDPLEKEMATDSSTPARRIPWTEEPDRLQSTGSQESDTTELLDHHHQPTPVPLATGSWRAVTGVRPLSWARKR